MDEKTSLQDLDRFIVGNASCVFPYYIYVSVVSYLIAILIIIFGKKVPCSPIMHVFDQKPAILHIIAIFMYF